MTKRLTVPEQHELKIARDTLKMPVGVMGGPDRNTALGIVARLGSASERVAAIREIKNANLVDRVENSKQ
jgi:hypothetical protein